MRLRQRIMVPGRPFRCCGSEIDTRSIPTTRWSVFRIGSIFSSAAVVAVAAATAASSAASAASNAFSSQLKHI